jgi:hypothetical protein
LPIDQYRRHAAEWALDDLHGVAALARSVLIDFGDADIDHERHRVNSSPTLRAGPPPSFL